MGTNARILIGDPLNDEAPDGPDLAEQVIGFLRDYESRLSRFNPQSELNALNRDERERVPVSPLLAQAIEAALWAAQFSGGLIDPTLLGQLQASGYRDSWQEERGLSLGEAVDRLVMREARANPDARWQQIRVADGFVIRPPGLEIEIGGSGKGWAADLVAPLFEGHYADWCVNLGGDMRLGGIAVRPIQAINPFNGQVLDTIQVLSGAVASSGLDSRLWLKDGQVYHHLLDPTSGLPAFSGLVSVTAYGATALEAEVRAKMALLAGPEASQEILAPGGIIVFADGNFERVGNLVDRKKRIVVSS